MTRFRYIRGIEMILDKMDGKVRELIKTVSSNLIRVQREENRDLTNRNRYLEEASFVSTYPGLTTTRALQYFSEELDQELSPTSTRLYARELKERKRVTIWGGPQGREYHIYPNVVDLATRTGYYRKETFVQGSVESRTTEDFRIKFEKWNYNKRCSY